MLQPPALPRPAAQPLAGARCWSLIVLGAGVRAVPLPGHQGAQRRGQDAGLHRAGGELRPAARLHRHRQLRAHDVLRHRRLRRRHRQHAARRRAGRRHRRSACCARARASRCVLSLVIGLFSLRVRAIFFAMITLAVASAFQTLASQLSDFTGGEDGLTFKMPEVAAARRSSCFETPFLGASIDGRLLTYYLLFVAAVVLLLALLRIVNSPFGRVLQAIRENDFRAEAIGYRTVVYRTLAQRAVGAVRHAGRRAARALAALQRARHLAVVRDHARHAADRRDRRHGHDLRRGDRRGAVRARAELPAGPAEARQRCALDGVPLARRAAVARPLAAVAGHPVRARRSTTFRAGIVGRLRAMARTRTVRP